jgi:hypothetical protein
LFERERERELDEIAVIKLALLKGLLLYIVT